jgi:hypothetical protein
MRHHDAGERGSSLISVLVAIGGIGIAIAAASYSFGLSVFASRAARSATAFAEVSTEIHAQLERQVLAHLNSGCSAAFFPAGVTLGDFGQMSRIAAKPTLPAVPTDPAILAAYNRCARAPLTPTAGANPAVYSFCMQYTRTKTVAKPSAESFLEAPQAFAEVLVKLVDPQNNNGVACTTPAAAATGMTAAIFYTIYWPVKVKPNTYQYKRYDAYRVSSF